MPPAPRRTARARRAARTLAAVVVAASALAACSSDPNSVAEQAKDGSDKGYISQGSTIEHIAPGKRGKPVTLSGTTFEGSAWKVADETAKGRYTVLNVWGSWCPPCVAEQPELDKAWAQMQAKKLPVQMMGVDIREPKATAQAYLDAKGVKYPSLVNDDMAMASLQGAVASPPTTLVLDKQGRIAARITTGTTAATLVGLVEDVIKDGE